MTYICGVKHLKTFGSFFFLVAFLLASSPSVFAFSETFSDSSSKKTNTYKAASNNTDVYFHEIAITQGVQYFSEVNFSLFPFIFSRSYELHFEAKKRVSFTNSAYVPDLRKQLGKHIFPFHFFW